MLANFFNRPLPPGLEGLADLALDLRWTWAILPTDSGQQPRRVARKARSEVRGSKFRKSRTSDLEPSPLTPVSRAAIVFPQHC